MPRNCSAAPVEFALIDRGLTLGFGLSACINDSPIIAKRPDKPPDTVLAETTCANLLHSALSSLVSAVRLALSGDHVDALALVRLGFESTYFADYFKRHPSDAVIWWKSAEIADPLARWRYLEDFAKSKKIHRTLENYYGDPSMTRLFRELSSNGSHASPETVSLRLSSSVSEIANIGFASSWKVEATALCASHALYCLAYLLSEVIEDFEQYVEKPSPILEEYDDFRRDFDIWHARPERLLSLYR
jgi:hypothetical protein